MENALTMHFAGFTRKKRQAEEISLSQFAEQLFSDASRKGYLSLVENGKKDISLKSADNILTALNASVEFYNRDGSPVKFEHTGSIAADFSQFLKMKRQYLGWSQEKMAARIYGNTKMRSFVSAIETGKKDITIITMSFFLDALDGWIRFVEK